MVVNQFNYLDLPNLFFNELVGNVYLAFFIGLLLIVWLGVKANIGGHALIGLSILWGFGVVGYQRSDMILIVIGVVVAFFYYGVIARYINK